MGKTLDFVVYGATGYTGRLVVEHLARWAPGVKWGIAGRDERKLRDIASAVGASCGWEPPVQVASAEDASGLSRMCASASVVIACAGPFIKLGEPVVAACIEEKTDYLDITGEPAFVKDIVQRHHDRAERAGVRVVPCCGFDSVPADLGVWFVMDHLKPKGAASAETFVHVNWDVSGGTWQTMLEMMAQSDPRKPPELPAIDGGGRRARLARPRPRFEPDAAGWVFPAPTIDPAIVLRSASALETYGPDFSYAFFFRMGSLPRAAAMGATMGTLYGLSKLGPTRRLLSKLKPSGQGAAPQERSKGFFRVTTVVRADGEKVVARVSGGDKYVETGTIAAEAAMLLALDKGSLPERHGVLTPAVAFGGALVKRLEDRGIRFEILRRTKEAS